MALVGSGASHVGVAFAFAPKGALRPVAGNEYRVVAHGPQALGDAGDQRVVVALRKIGAANGTCKQHITDKRAVDLGRVKHHMAWRVAGAMAHVQRAVAHGDGVAVVQPACRREDVCGRKTKHLALLRQTVNPELVARVGADDGDVECLRQLGRATGVVDVGVGLPDLGQRHPPLFHLGQQPVQVATRVDDGGLLGLIAPEKGAVLRKGGDGDGRVVQHFIDVLGLQAPWILRSQL